MHYYYCLTCHSLCTMFWPGRPDQEPDRCCIGVSTTAVGRNACNVCVSRKNSARRCLQYFAMGWVFVFRPFGTASRFRTNYCSVLQQGCSCDRVVCGSPYFLFWRVEVRILSKTRNSSARFGRKFISGRVLREFLRTLRPTSNLGPPKTGR